MTKTMARRKALLMLTAGALGTMSSSGCTTLGANFVPNKFYWVGSNSPTPLDATDLSRGGLPSFTVGYKDCEAVAARWATIQNDLIKEVHNKLVDNKSPTMTDAALLAVSPPIASPEFLISFTNDSLSAGGGLGFNYAQTLSANVNSSGQKTSIGLSLAQITSKLSLGEAVRSCVRKNACIELGRRIAATQPPSSTSGGVPGSAEPPKSIQYVAQILYGSSMLLKISGAKTSTNADIQAKYGPYGGEVRFKLNTDNVSILSSFFGSVKSIPDLEKLDKFFTEKDKEKRYDVPALITDLNDKRIINVMQRWSQLVDQQNVVAVVLEEMTVKDCESN